jgi:hypothetical protein
LWTIGEPGGLEGVEYPDRRSNMSARKFLLLLLIGLTVATCAPAPPEPVSIADIERAQSTLLPFKAQLLEALTGALDAGGPIDAISVCRDEAPRIAGELGVDGIRMGRTSHRLRNPANAPEPWVEPLLAEYVADPALEEPKAVRLGDGTFGYVEPIQAASFCMSCHGPSVEPDLLAEIRALYPEDQATDFRVGEVRGLFWVQLPLGES